MELNSPSATDMLVIMPPSVQQEAEDFFNICEQTPTIGEYAMQICKVLLHAIVEHDIPGAKFGLVPFEDIVLSEDGQTMIWNEEIDDWDLLEDIHPCKNVPGSNWGKFFYDLTPGEFFTKNKRPQVEYSHASPAKRLLESLQTTHFLATSGTTGGSGPVNNGGQKIQAKNMQLSVATGVAYPVYDNERLQITPHLSDVSALVNEPFVLPPKKIPRLYELSQKIEEISTGAAPAVKDTQEQEVVVYRIPQ
ncbi:hypothetical protein SBRCBS47491_009979 [Sporothrix bragantina]|uniref:AMP-dependent synthetase/ligase domain-containing protein n=1 Tax=Sporothrix bragantina TaxID=671064 RepID=A0ABP0CZ91_9PEZI